MLPIYDAQKTDKQCTYAVLVISSCSTSSSGYHADSGLCFGLFDLDLRKYDDARDECSLATINDQGKWDFIKSAASDLFQGISE